MRSLLFVPADSERKLARGPQSGADALILDLEDSVAPSQRDSARSRTRDFLEATGSAGFQRWVQVNPLASGFALDDLAAVATGSIRVIAIATETPAAMFLMGGYAGASPRLAGITWGAEDLAAAIGGSNRRRDGVYEDVYRLARSFCL